MSGAVKTSEAVSLALHAMAVLKSRHGKVMPVRDIATALNASEAHLSKVLQRLSRSGMLKSVRGPSGGYSLRNKEDDFSLLEVYEVMEGPLEIKKCLFEVKVCSGQNCMLGGLLERLNRELFDYLTATNVSDLAVAFDGGDGSKNL